MVKAWIKRLMMLMQVLRRRDDGAKVLFYHDIGTRYTPMGTPESLFWSHMAHLRTKVEVEGGGGQRNARHHEVAFDDGFKGIWDSRELLRKYDIHPIVFIAVALVGQPGYLTWDEIRTLQNDYGFEFQCHTWSHQTLIGPVNTDLPVPSNPDFRTDAWYHHELVDSKAELERQLSLNRAIKQSNNQTILVTSLCFPVGNFSDDVIARCKAAGYKKVYASYPGNITDDYVRPRNIVQDCGLLDFKLVVCGGLMAFYNRYYRRHKVET